MPKQHTPVLHHHQLNLIRHVLLVALHLLLHVEGVQLPNLRVQRKGWENNMNKQQGGPEVKK